MEQVLAFVLIGLLTGAVYGLSSLGLVLSNKSSGIFNFAHGALFAAAALCFYWLHVTLGLHWVMALALSVLVLGPMMGVAMELVSRHLARQRPVLQIAGTVGLMIFMIGLGRLVYPDTRQGALSIERFLPLSDHGTQYWEVGGLRIFYDQVLVAGVAVAVAFGLFIMFRCTSIGLQIKAVVDDPDLLDMHGIRPRRVRRIAWITSSTFAALSGVLILPAYGLDPQALTFLATWSFGAAAIARFKSIPMAFVGGLIVGVGSEMVRYAVNQRGLASMQGLPDALPFVFLIVALMMIPRRDVLRANVAERSVSAHWHGSPAFRIGSGVVVVIALALVPTFAGSQQPYFTTGVTQAILLLSLGLLVRLSGQVSLCQVTYAAIGAVAFSQLTMNVGLPWGVALLLAVAITVPVGALVALPAIRLHGVYLGLATFGFSVVVQQLFFPMSWMFTTYPTSRPVPKPEFAQSPTGYYLLCLGFLVAACLLVVMIEGSRLGRVLRGLAEAPAAVTTLGLSTNITKLVVFCISAALAAVSGVLYAGGANYANPQDQFFQPMTSLVLLAVLILSPFRTPWYAVFAAVMAVIPGYWKGEESTYWLEVILGISALAVAAQGGLHVMPLSLRRRLTRISARTSHIQQPTAAPTGRAQRDSRPLVVEDLKVRFGGLVAVDGMSLTVHPGTITGLIGPNGAGKSTTFNAINGLVRPASGQVSLGERPINRWSTPRRGRAGMGRTFQRADLCASLSVLENVSLGVEAPRAGAGVLSHLSMSSRARREALGRAYEAIGLCGIQDIAYKPAGQLSTGERRLVELARCLAGPYDLLLLDEPSSGLDKAETLAFSKVLTHVVEGRGLGVLLVEHDISLVLGVCSYVYVMEAGRLIFEGPAGDVRRSEEVERAYLGPLAQKEVEDAS